MSWECLGEAILVLKITWWALAWVLTIIFTASIARRS